MYLDERYEITWHTEILAAVQYELSPLWSELLTRARPPKVIDIIVIGVPARLKT